MHVQSASQSSLEDFDGSVNCKRKQAGKLVSMIPSVVDDDMDNDMHEIVNVFLICFEAWGMY